MQVPRAIEPEHEQTRIVVLPSQARVEHGHRFLKAVQEEQGQAKFCRELDAVRVQCPGPLEVGHGRIEEPKAALEQGREKPDLVIVREAMLQGAPDI